MNPVDFPNRTNLVAEDQPEYRTLPAYVDSEETISCWRFTFGERLRILFGAPLWLRQLNFGRPLQPQLPTLDSPFDGRKR